ncbi:hypothetical protein [Tenacibaculum sp. IB213877]|uniref:hypothetical protein n=1 Tax=Tenacibaculum sp. IB213877 TaxID=3097351 RepID=UPI002A5AE8ED|nr:hypothetical protein [Tenacibaculum sp. IB213877]MDY0780884.1 hypothetical protein [Tenacibaculum sp. IB213877]
MKVEHLEERVNDYKESIKLVVDKKIKWGKEIKPLIASTLKNIVEKYSIGWKMQELSWINNNEAVNVTFDSFPRELMDCTNQIPEYQFVTGGSLVFSQSYSGDVYIFILFPFADNMTVETNTLELGMYSPQEITAKLIVEKVDEFLKEMIKWEVPAHRSKMGFQNKET